MAMVGLLGVDPGNRGQVSTYTADSATIGTWAGRPAPGDLMVAFFSIRPSSVTLATLGGWTQVSDRTYSDGSGTVRHYVFTRVANGAEGNSVVSFARTGTITEALASIQVVRSATKTYDVAATYANHTSTTTSWSDTMAADPGITSDDLVLVSACTTGNNGGYTSSNTISVPSVTSSGVKISSDWGTTSAHLSVASYSARSGTSSGAATVATTHPTACQGITVLVRIRQGSGTATADPWIMSSSYTVATTAPYYWLPEHRSGDLLVASHVLRGASDSNNVLTSVPSGWTEAANWVGGTGTEGADSGRVRTYIHYKTADSTDEARGSLSNWGATNATRVIGRMYAVAAAPGKTGWALSAVGNAVARETTPTVWSEAASASATFKPTDVVIAHLGSNTNDMTDVSAPVLTATGATFDDLRVVSFSTAASQTAESVFLTTKVVAGAAATPTVGITWAGTAPTNGPAGSFGVVSISSTGASVTAGAASASATAQVPGVRGSAPYYPVAIPLTETAGTYLDSNPHSVLHDELYDEIVAIGTELGTVPKGSFGSVRARLDALEKVPWTEDSTASNVVVTQGGAALTMGAVNVNQIVTIGKRTFWRLTATVSGTGTAGNALTLALPSGHTAVSAASIRGIANLYNGSGGTWGYNRVAMVRGSSTTAIQFYNQIQNFGSGTGAYGVNPSIAFSGDVIRMIASWEIA